jgi:hypothetical protein
MIMERKSVEMEVLERFKKVEERLKKGEGGNGDLERAVAAVLEILLNPEREPCVKELVKTRLSYPLAFDNVIWEVCRRVGKEVSNEKRKRGVCLLLEIYLELKKASGISYALRDGLRKLRTEAWEAQDNEILTLYEGIAGEFPVTLRRK